ncbi:GUN4 domain-containing protein [Calothrix sp. 336/3]|uniref:GUN4 domain-containing protein n=1 Tax=Calothrix sp. 336/3 TaxID=1337936 RepID=UPI001438E5BC|nr:GUN4 domain-containing protein [Calothrix sp. 336/3]
MPIFTVVINGVLAYFINQLPGIRPDPEKGITGLSDTSIFAITAIFTIALCIFTLAAQSQQNSTASNINSSSSVDQSNSLGGFLLFLIGAVIYGLLQLKIIPEENQTGLGYLSLILCGFGAAVPSFLLIPQRWQNILLFICSGTGVFLTFHYFSVQKLNSAFISFIFTLFSIVLLLTRDFLVQVIRNVAHFWEDLQNQQADDKSKFIINLLEDFFSPFQKKYYKALEYKCRDDETQGLDNDRTLELQKVFVQLKIAAKSASNTQQNIIPSDVNKFLISSEITIWDCLAARDEKGKNLYKKLVILGRPGSGKTTLLRYLTLIYATKQEQNIHVENSQRIPKLIPILFYLREIRDIIISQNPALETLIQQQIEKLIEKFKITNQNLSIPSHWVTNKLQQNKLLIMLDGLDEVADKIQRQQVRTWVDEQMQAHPDTIFILTSRPNGYKEVQSHISVDELEVQPFNREQITDFLQRWYLQTEIKSRAGQCDEGVRQIAAEQAHNLINRIVNNRSLVAMAVNPLLLKMIATVHRRGNVLPGKRVELYKDICQILLEKRQRAKNIIDGLTASQKQSILQEIALQLMLARKRDFTLNEAETWISQQLTTLPKLNNTDDFIKHVRDDCALLVEKEIGEYEFAHLSFQEYLAAVEIIESNQESILIQNIDKTWWSETIRLYAAQAKDATPIVSAIIHMSSPSINAFLVVADYEDEGWRIEQQVRDELVNKLDTGLESDDAEIFNLAVEVKLAKRLNNLVRVDENLEQDRPNSYITCAEYQLFINDRKYSPPPNWQNHKFRPGDAKKTVTGLNKRDANRFCTWLSGKELKAQFIKLETFCQPLEGDNDKICLTRVKLPSKYSQLADYLYQQEWRKADEETSRVMLQVVGKEEQGYFNLKDIETFPCEDLYIINLLWVVESQGRFGFSVQQDIYHSLGGTKEYNEKIWNDFGDRVGWKKGGSWLSYHDYTFNLNAPQGHVPAMGHDGDWGDFSSLAQRLVDCNI